MRRHRRAKRWIPALTIGLLGVAPVVSAVTPVGAAPAAAPCSPPTPVVVGTGRNVATVDPTACPLASAPRFHHLEVLRGPELAPVRDLYLQAEEELVDIEGLEVGEVYRFRSTPVTEAGDGQPGPLSEPLILPVGPASAFVERLSKDFLGRSATTAERAARTSSLADGSTTPAALVGAYQASPEHQRQSPIIRLYRAYFLRLPDASGLAYWTGRSRAGVRLVAISEQFARSSEFTRRYGALDNRAFVELVYRNVLGREGDPAGIASWTGKLDARTKTRGEVMAGFSESSEYRRRSGPLVDVVNAFTGMLRRIPTAVELERWQGAPLLRLHLELLGNPGYVARASDPHPLAVTSPATLRPSYEPGRDSWSTHPAPYLRLTAAGGTGDRTWDLVGGALPTGLVLDPSGHLFQVAARVGAPTTFTIRVTDATGASATRAMTFLQANRSIATRVLNQGQVGRPYYDQLHLNGIASATWSVVSGALPGGLELDSAKGVITGVPEELGAHLVTIQATVGGGVATREYAIEVVEPHRWPQVGRDAGASAAALGDRSLTIDSSGWVGPGYTLASSGIPVVDRGLVLGAGRPTGSTSPAQPFAWDSVAGTMAGTWPATPASCDRSPVAISGDALHVACEGVTSSDLNPPREQRWTSAGPAGAHHRLISTGTSLVLWADDAISARDAGTGQVAWSAEIAEPSSAVAVVVDDGKVLVARSDRLEALDLATGEVAWTRADVTPSSLVALGGFLYLGTDEGQVLRVRVDDGTTDWAQDLGAASRVFGVDADQLYVGIEPGSVSALSTTSGAERWTYVPRGAATPVQSIAVTGEFLTVVTDDASDPFRSALIWAFDRGSGLAYGVLNDERQVVAPIAAAGGIFALALDGREHLDLEPVAVVRTYVHWGLIEGALPGAAEAQTFRGP